MIDIKSGIILELNEIFLSRHYSKYRYYSIINDYLEPINY